MTEKISLTIDDVEVSVDPGTLIIRAAEQIGVRIPRFCDHPLLKPVAACRQCLVEVATPDREGNVRAMPKPQPSCAVTVSPGMVVRTQETSDMAREAQEGVMEFLLINHPLDCPICDKGGECPLQNQAMTEGRSESRFQDAKRVFRKPMRLTTQIMLDRERCILCQRCVRFAKEIPGDAFLDLQGRGGGSAPTDAHYFMGEQVGSFDAEVLDFSVPGVDGPKRTDISGPYGSEGIISSVYSGPLQASQKDQAGRTFGSYFSGNIIQICPVGALTATSYRFRARPFDLVSTPSVTEHDASGSNIRVDVRRGEVVRRLARTAPEINEEWITDKDRFAFEWTNVDRLKVPLVRVDGELVPTSWSAALDLVAKRLQETRDAGTAIGLLPGERITFEDAWAWSKFARAALGTNNIDSRWREQSDEEAAFLGARVAGQGLGVTYQQVENAPQVVLVAFDPEDECGALFLRLRKGVTSGRTKVTAVATHLSPGNQKLGAQLVPAAVGQEVAALESLDPATLDADTVILVGERAARTPGLLSAAAALADRTGAKLQWVPRRSGSRAGVDAGLLPNLLPFGRPVADAAANASTNWGAPTSEGLSAARIIEGAAAGKFGALVVGGIDLRDWPNPEQARAALKETPFVVSLEVRDSAVMPYADVVLPVAPAVEKNGTFINWEGRLCPFGQAYVSRALTDRDILGRIATEMGVDLGVSTLTHIYAEANPLMDWGGARTDAPTVPADSEAPTGLRLVFHKPLVDLGILTTGADDLRLAARQPVALVSPTTLAQLNVPEDALVTVTGPRGAITLPIEAAVMADNSVWVPECSVGDGVHEDLGQLGDTVTVTAVPKTEVSAK